MFPSQVFIIILADIYQAKLANPKIILILVYCLMSSTADLVHKRWTAYKNQGGHIKNKQSNTLDNYFPVMMHILSRFSWKKFQ